MAPIQADVRMGGNEPETQTDDTPIEEGKEPDAIRSQDRSLISKVNRERVKKYGLLVRILFHPSPFNLSLEFGTFGLSGQ